MKNLLLTLCVAASALPVFAAPAPSITQVKPTVYPLNVSAFVYQNATGAQLIKVSQKGIVTVQPQSAPVYVVIPGFTAVQVEDKTGQIIGIVYVKDGYKVTQPPIVPK
jgi:hypothetical protein